MAEDFDDFDEDDDSDIVHTSDGKARPNSTDDEKGDDQYAVTAAELRQIVEQIEQLEAEKKDLADEVKEQYASAKARGYDTKALRTIIAQRKKDRDELAEQEAIVTIYKAALGMD